MPLKHAPILLEELANGAALEHFEAGVRKVAEDIDDASKKTEAKRSFQLKFTFDPDAQGYSTKITCELVGVTLAPSRPAVTSAFLAREGGQLEILEVQQTESPLPDNTVSIEAGKKKED